LSDLLNSTGDPNNNEERDNKRSVGPEPVGTLFPSLGF
jgi:hypothetical protein